MIDYAILCKGVNNVAGAALWHADGTSKICDRLNVSCKVNNWHIHRGQWANHPTYIRLFSIITDDILLIEWSYVGNRMYRDWRVLAQGLHFLSVFVSATQGLPCFFLHLSCGGRDPVDLDLDRSGSHIKFVAGIRYFLD